MIANLSTVKKLTIELSSDDLFDMLMNGSVIANKHDDSIQESEFDEIMIYCDHPQDTREKYDKEKPFQKTFANLCQD